MMSQNSPGTDQQKTLRESEIKSAIIDLLFDEKMLEDDAIVVSEMPLSDLGRRADLVIAGENLVGIEIKSNYDSTARLSGQLEAYKRYFEGVIVVTAERHLEDVLLVTPPDVGIFVISSQSGSKFHALQLRKPRFRRMNIEMALRQLHTSDLAKLARKFGLFSSSNNDRYSLEAIVKQIPSTDVRQSAIAAVKKRYKPQFTALLEARSLGLAKEQCLTFLKRPAWKSLQSIPHKNVVETAVTLADNFKELRLVVRPRRAC